MSIEASSTFTVIDPATMPALFEGRASTAQGSNQETEAVALESAPPQLAAVKQRTDNAVTGERLLRRAEETATLSYTQDIGAHRFGASLFASGEREDFGGVELPGYVLANLTAQFNLSNVWALHARIENLLDTEYETAAGFRMQERGAFVELKYRWK